MILPSSQLVAPVALPPLVAIEQAVPDDSLADPVGTAGESLRNSPMAAAVRPGMHVAVAVGSRGIANTPEFVDATVRWLKSLGAVPFVVPAMGSHGRASAAGQVELLAELGVTEARVGCPIVSSMEVVALGQLDDGFTVYMDRNAFEADAVFVINRVKPHTAFRGRHESGIVKIITIGLGKQIGANSCHARGYQVFPELLPKMAAFAISKARFLGALAIVENSLDKTCIVEAVPIDRLFERDAALLEIARTKMPSIPFARFDVLIVDEIGKNITGGGMDSNVVGRFGTKWITAGPEIDKIGLLDITRESHGNGMGMGFADFITYRLRDKLDFEAAYVNALTSTTMAACSMPCALSCDRDVFKAAVKTCHVPKTEDVRFVRIKNTLMLKYMQISPALIPEALERGCRVLGEPMPAAFTDDGELVGRGAWPE